MSLPRPKPARRCSIFRVGTLLALILVAGAVTGLAVQRGAAGTDAQREANPDTEGASARRHTDDTGATAEWFTPGWWQSDETRCPAGARFRGSVPPEGLEVWCARDDGERDGIAIRWHANGRRAFLGTYQDGVLHGAATEWLPDGRIWRQAVYDHGQLQSWSRWSDSGEFVDHGSR